MKVKELIEKLHEFDPEMLVAIADWTGRRDDHLPYWDESNIAIERWQHSLEDDEDGDFQTVVLGCGELDPRWT